MATSLNGFPVIAPGRSGLRTGVVPNCPARKITTASFALPLFLALAADYHRWVRPLDKGTWDEGGYNYRPARGASAWSNHASGTAVDLNWSKEGAQNSAMGKAFFAIDANEEAVRRILRMYPIIDWGGDWRALDFMHFELAPGTTRADVEKLIKHLGIDNKGVRHNDWKGRPLNSPLDVVS